MTSTLPVTVMIVDDHPVVRHGLSALLSVEPWVARVVEAATMAQAAQVGLLEHPDVAVVDLGLPDGSGVQLIARLRATVPHCAVLVLTMDEDQHAVRACLAEGARGYLLKTVSPDAVVRAIRTVTDGGLVLGPGVTDGRWDSGAAAQSWPRPLDRLSPQDLWLLALVADGTANPSIARQLGVTEKTVRNRLSSILSTLGVADRVQAALLARDHGLSTGRLKGLAGSG